MDFEVPFDRYPNQAIRVADPDPHYFKKMDPDPQWSEKLDPDPHESNNSEA
jgi:hypothetical protein